MMKILLESGLCSPDAEQCFDALASANEPKVVVNNNDERIDPFQLVRTGNLDGIMSSLSTISDVNIKNTKGQTLLYYAICYNQVDIAKYLIFCGARLDKIDTNGESLTKHIKKLGVEELLNTEQVIEDVQAQLLCTSSCAEVEHIGEFNCYGDCTIL